MISISSKVRSLVSGRRKKPQIVVSRDKLPQKKACRNVSQQQAMVDLFINVILTVFPWAFHAVGDMKYGCKTPPIIFAT